MINVAIDGPAGAGKSTIARKVAADLGYMYIDTGAMYRSLAYKAITGGISISDEPMRVISMLDDTALDIKYIGGTQHMLCDGSDITDYIRTPEVSAGASAIAAIPEVRAWLLQSQRSLASDNNCLMDGRDIGTVVLPFANIKIFLTASAEARAKRRYDELILKGEDVTFEDVLSDMIKRDNNDSTRACAPLKQADDAILVDTSDLSFDESVAKIKNIIADKVGDK
ncbi:MAG: (d)CMP kinase [Clostridia bacterium]|nr:(d)CMP kinase [Clostridia bacterium]